MNGALARTRPAFPASTVKAPRCTIQKNPTHLCAPRKMQKPSPLKSRNRAGAAGGEGGGQRARGPPPPPPRGGGGPPPPPPHGAYFSVSVDWCAFAYGRWKKDDPPIGQGLQKLPWCILRMNSHTAPVCNFSFL